MYERITELLEFFPVTKIDFVSGTGDQYLFDLTKTVNDNYDAGNFQVAFFYCHLLFMSFVYYKIYKAYQVNSSRVSDIYYPIRAYDKKEKVKIDMIRSVYDFSKIPEKEIFKVFHALDMGDEVIGTFSNYINNSERDEYAHATGKGNMSIEALEDNVTSIIMNMSKIQSFFDKNIKDEFIDFLLQNKDKNYISIQDAIENFIYDNELSGYEIHYCMKIGLSNYRNKNEVIKREYHRIKNVFCEFIEYCAYHFSYKEPNSYFDWINGEEFLLFKYKDNAKEFVENELHISEYECVKDGDTFPLYECPNCENEQLVYDANDKNYICFSCGQRFDDLIFCCECGKPFIPKEDEIICPDCWREKLEKE